MNILSISSILPLPGYFRTNDFVFHTYLNYRNIYERDNVVFIKPIQYNLNLVTILKKQTLLHKLNKQFKGDVYGFKVQILPFFSIWRYRNIHALITTTIYCLNIRKIDALINQYKFNVIHAQYIFPDGLLAYILSKKLGIPYLITSHNERSYFDHLISRKIALKIFRNASMIIPINHTNYLYYRSLGINNVLLTPLGFDRSFLRPPKPASTDRISILTIADLIRLKNIDKVLMALKPLVSAFNIHYTIIGQGPEKENLLKLTKSLGIMDYVDILSPIPHNQIANEMYKHDIYIMPSFFETFGRVYFEVMAMGIPIICARNSGIYGIFKEGEEGLSVDHENISSIEKALEFLIRSPEKRLQIGLNGKKLVERYTWENIAKDLQAKYTGTIQDFKKP